MENVPQADPPPAPLPALPPYADGVERRFEVAWIHVERIGGLVFAVVVLSVAAVALLATIATGKLHGAAAWSTCALYAVLAPTWLVLAASWPKLEWDKAGWRVLPDRIEMRRGLVWRSVTSVPISRVQYTDVKQGPLMRRHDIASLVVHTAGTLGSEVEFPGLARATAVELRDWLVAQTGSDAV
jgi:membrane protein YdbS with pleckstrin-like domain